MRPRIALLTTVALLVAGNVVAPVSAAGGGVSFVEPLASPLTFPNGGGVAGVAAGDVNGDGIQDVAATQDTNIGGVGARGYISIMLGNGDGTLGDPTHITMPDSPTPSYGGGIVLADLVGDSDLDLAVASAQLSAILLYRGNGDGTFATPTSLPTTGPPSGLTSGDLDGAGKADLATYYSGVNMAAVFLNGTGGFEDVQDYAVDANPQAIAIASLDASAGADLLVGTYDAKKLNVLSNKGDGTFADAVASSARLQVTGLWTGDFNTDGDADAVVSGYAPEGGSPPCYANCVQVLFGNGDGTFAPGVDQDLYSVEEYPGIHFSETQATDLNGDGTPDVVFVHESRNYVTVGYSSSDGSLDIAEYIGSPGPGFTVSDPDGVGFVSTAIADLNGDGRPDLVVGARQTNPRPGGVSILLGGGPGGFQTPRAYGATRRWTDGATRASVLADFNNDGAPDVVVITDALDFVPGNGDGTFGKPSIALGHISGPGEFYNTIRAADFDKDGKMDVAWAATNGVQGGFNPRNLIAFGTGSGTFGDVIALGPRVSDWAGRNLVLGDYTGDGYTDIAVWTDAQYGNAAELDLYYYNPDVPRSFETGPVLSLGGTNEYPGFGLASADVNGDGALDLITHMAAGGTSAGEQLFVFLGDGAGAFADPLITSPGLPDLLDIAVADVNGDGKADLLGAGSNQVDVMFGNGDGTFDATTAYSAGIAAGHLAPVDIDGDGILDLAVGHFGCTCANGFGVLPGEGNGTFGEYIGFAVGGGTLSSMAVHDLTGDGKPDVVAGHNNSVGQLTVLINDSVPVAQSHDRTVTLQLKGGLIAKGSVTAEDGTTSCVDRVSVLIQKKKSGKWQTIDKTKTESSAGGSSTYKVSLPDKPGSYRAKVPKLTLDSGQVCSSAVSPPRKND